MIFSRNRALQLYALLESMDMYFDMSLVNVNILCRYDVHHVDSLNDVMNAFPNHNFIDEVNFEADVKEFLASPKDYVAFLTDDIIFKDNVNLQNIGIVLGSNDQILAFSLRMGLHIHECWSVNKEQPFPPGQIVPPNMFVWNWREGAYDWGYPFSVDGHVFRKSSFAHMVSGLSFNNPNTFEDAIQVLMNIPDMQQGMVCHTLSSLVNLPINRVQDTHQNRCGLEDSDFLLNEYWVKGKKIDVASYRKVLNRGAHSDLELFTKDR